VLLLLGGKQHSYAQGHMLCLHYTLCLMQLSVLRNLILMGCSDDIPVSGLLVIDAVGWRSNAQSKSHSDPLIICTLSLFYQLPNCNLFTQLVLFYLWRDTASELWIPVLFPLYCYHMFTLLALFTLLSYYYHFPLDTLIPFVSSKPVRLTTSS
jgi:hypothetical protein